MKASVIDLEQFFSDENSCILGEGINGVGVITTSQMIVRYTCEGIDPDTNKHIKGIGTHFEEFALVLSEIFGLPKNLQDKFYYYNPEVYNSLSEDEKKVLEEVIFVSLKNYPDGNYVTISLPKYGSITTNQFLAIKYLGKLIEKAAISRPVNINVGYPGNFKSEESSIENEIIPFIENLINDNFIQSVPDRKIIAKDDIEIDFKKCK